MYQHPLPDLETIAGTVKITLFSEFETLSLPSGQTIVSIGDLEETADVGIGVTQLSTLRLSLKEDYSNYTEGFWYKVLAGECWIRFYLVEDENTTFYFFGLPQEETIEWTEHFLGASEYLRTCELELVSMAFKLLDVPTVDWRDEVLANSVDTGATVLNDPSHKISVMGLFSAMLSAAGLNTTYLENDTTFVYDTPDFRYTEGGNDYTLDDVNIAVKVYIGGGTHSPTEWFLSSSNAELAKKFSKLRELIPNLLANFGLVLRFTYDPSGDGGNGRHRIELIQRGRAYSTTLNFNGREKISTISKSADLIGDATRVSFLLPETDPPTENLGYGTFVWFSKKYLDGKSIDEVPDYVDFDKEYQTMFLLNIYIPQSGIGHSRQLYLVSGTTWTILTGIEYFNYTSQSYVIASATGARLVEEATAGYVYYRFTNQYTKVVRTYGTLKADDGSTESHAHASILRRTNLNLDDTGDVPFYANRVKKSIERNELEIEWIKE